MLMVFLSVAALLITAAIAHRSLSGKPMVDRAIKASLQAARENDRIDKVPTVQVIGSQPGSFEGAAAILGSSNIIQALQGLNKKEQQ